MNLKNVVIILDNILVTPNSVSSQENVYTGVNYNIYNTDLSRKYLFCTELIVFINFVSWYLYGYELFIINRPDSWRDGRCIPGG